MDSEKKNPFISEEFRNIVAASLDSFTLVDMTGQIIDVNDSYCQLTGYTRGELLHMYLSEIEAFADAEIVAQRFKETVHLGTLRFESKLLHKDGSIVDIEVSATYTPHHGGVLFSYIRDITQQKHLERASRTREELYKSIVETQTVFVSRHLPGGIITYANPALARFMGVSSDEFRGKSISPFIYQNGQDETVKCLESINADNPVVETECEIVLPNNRVHWISWTHSGVFDEFGTLVEYQSVGTDISIRKQTENKLRLSEEKFSTAFRVSPDAINITRLSDGKYLETNVGFTELSGFTAEEVYGKTSVELGIWVHPEDRIRLTTELNEQGVVNNMEAQFRCKNGAVITCLMSARVIRSLDEVCILSISRDISARKRIEEALLKSEQNFRAINDTSPLPLALTDKQGKITYLNRSFEQIIGYTVSDIPTIEAWWPRVCPDQQYRQLIIDSWQKNLDDAQSTGRSFTPVEMDVVCKDGSVRTFMCSSTALEENVNASHLIVFYDITVRKKAEDEKFLLDQQFQQTQKLESLGILAGGIAHDFNNLLTIIIGNCSLASIKPKFAEEYIQNIHIAANRAAELCRQMLAYAGKSQSIVKSVNLGTEVRDMVTMLQSTISRNVAIHLNLPEIIPSIQADESQLRQVIMNLIINAAEAIGETQGEVLVSLEVVRINTGRIRKDHLGSTIRPGMYLCMEVTDSGCGMDDETKRRVFEPFFTTKFTGRGLGMSAVLGIIKTHFGALQFYSEQGLGTTFKVYFPAQNDDSCDDTPPAPATQESWRGSGTILLVEDEELIVLVAQAILEELGFSVIIASNGKEALELYQKNTKEVFLVITDIGMPVMDGYELCQQLKAQTPDLPIIISSGFQHVVVSSRVDPENIAGLISKPYNLDMMREVLKSVIDELN
jgi:PAS domain S-box-containing protein